ncbi:MAG TPA: hypothetical protein VGR26_03220 [Acidimicrobiales bacterium]|nr:hypothetical protein [Acidimicrobiales bacterium]
MELTRNRRRDGKLVFDDDPPAWVAWEATTRKIYLDERHRAGRARVDFAEGDATQEMHQDGPRHQAVRDSVTDQAGQPAWTPAPSWWSLFLPDGRTLRTGHPPATGAQPRLVAA